ncbi:hypothetical protein BaRGS_00024922 [Batillaria attramentaria]|uniref:Ig-like domain-containing protein n=1 Tax=Batillaria attramentaria TaxID=370345 RepID=A0ABD0K9S0_9CAEN
MGGPKLCLLGILLISIFRTPDVRAVTRCDAPAAYRHERAVITCYYETDVGFTKKDFSVYKRDVHDKYIDVLSCSWRTTPPDCKVSDGYIFDGNVTETMILVIPSATEEQEGQYTCQTIPSDPEDLVSCNFTLKRLEVTANMNTEDTPTANNDNGGFALSRLPSVSCVIMRPQSVSDVTAGKQSPVVVTLLGVMTRRTAT